MAKTTKPKKPKDEKPKDDTTTIRPPKPPNV